MIKLDHYAVFGHPVSHSKSPRIHHLFAEQTGQSLEYFAQDVPAESFATATTAFFANGGQGLNCTLPLKELAWNYADQLTGRARLAGAVNTLMRQNDGRIIGDNTDGIGLVTDLTINHGIKLADSRILILGAGGACRGIVGPLLEYKPECLVIANRTISKAENIAREFGSLGKLKSCDFGELVEYRFDLIINATSTSLSTQLPPLPANLPGQFGCCYDLAYGDLPTAFVEWGLNNKAVKSLDGLGMLVEQAAEAFFVWRGVRPQTSGIIEMLNNERQASHACRRY